MFSEEKTARTLLTASSSRSLRGRGSAMKPTFSFSCSRVDMPESTIILFSKPAAKRRA